MDTSRLNLVVATAALQGIGYNSERLRQLFESSLVQPKEPTDFEQQDAGYFEGPGRLSVDGSKVAKYNPALNQFKCHYCGVTGNVQRLAEHYLASHIDTSTQIFNCPKCPYTSPWARCVRTHLNKQHGLTEIPPEMWAIAHPLLSETTKLLNDLKTYVTLQTSMMSSAAMNERTIDGVNHQMSYISVPPTKIQTKPRPHQVIDISKITRKRYSCERCAYSTDRRDLYNRHENIHKEDKPFHCYVCQKLFNRADHVKKHFLRIHKGRPYDVALIRRHNANNGAGMKTPTVTSAVDSSTLVTPLALALAHHTVQQASKLEPTVLSEPQLQSSTLNSNLSIGALVNSSLNVPKVVVPIGPITPASSTSILTTETVIPMLKAATSTVKRRADSSTSKSKVLVETTKSPVVCIEKNTAIPDQPVERHVRAPYGSKSNKKPTQKRTYRKTSEDATVAPSSKCKKTTDASNTTTVPIGKPAKGSTSIALKSSSGTSSKKRETIVLDPSQVKEYACDLCPWRGVDGWGLRRHFNTHLKPFRCQFCDYRAARSERLGAHVLRVHGKHLCAKCDLSFIDAMALDNHVRTQHRSTNQYTRPRPASSADSAAGSGRSGESPAPADDDSIEMTTDYDSRINSDEMMSFVDEKDVDEGGTIFHCRWCILSFADKLSLKYHLETKHSGAPVGSSYGNNLPELSPAFPYQCTICGFKCFTQGTIMDHMRIHSGQLARCRVEVGSSKSPSCGFATPFDSELTNHVANLHGQRIGHTSQCLHCGLMIDKAEELMEHVKENHHVNPLECSVCRNAFLEYFPAFYGNICPSTAPLADQYTHLPQFLASNPSGFLEKLLTDVYKNLTDQKSLDAKTASIILSTIHKLKKHKSTATRSVKKITAETKTSSPQQSSSSSHQKSSTTKPLKSLKLKRIRCHRCPRIARFATLGAKKVHVLLKHSGKPVKTRKANLK